jgi:hypothetical protein
MITHLGLFLQWLDVLLGHVFAFGAALTLERDQLAIDELTHRVF